MTVSLAALLMFDVTTNEKSCVTIYWTLSAVTDHLSRYVASPPTELTACHHQVSTSIERFNAFILSTAAVRYLSIAQVHNSTYEQATTIPFAIHKVT